MYVREEKPMVRLVFSKKGTAKYISHLDMQRTMQRTLKRAEIPVWYSEGFNPHPYLCFASPLPVGTEGEQEVIDFRLADEMPFEEIKDRMNRAFPLGFEAKAVYEGKAAVKEIAFAEYDIHFPKEIEKLFESFLAEETIPIIKTTKRSQKEIDLKKEIKEFSFSNDEIGFLFHTILPCGSEQNINPQLIIKAFEEKNGKVEICRIMRNRFFKADMSVFQ